LLEPRCDGRFGARCQGDREGQWAMPLNGRWRICFEFRKGNASNVGIVDYRKG